MSPTTSNLALLRTLVEKHRTASNLVPSEWRAADRRCGEWIKAGFGMSTGGFEHQSMHERERLQSLLRETWETTVVPLAAAVSEQLGDELLSFWRGLLKVEDPPRAFWKTEWNEPLAMLATRLDVYLERQTPQTELHKVAVALRDLNRQCKGISNQSAEALAGANLREAVKLGAFAGAEYAELRYLIEQPERPPDGMTIDRAVGWLFRKKKLPKWVSPLSSEWLPEALLPVADLIDAEDLKMQAQIAATEPASAAVVVPDGFYSPTDIARAMNAPVKADAIRMALKRLFDENRVPDGAWMENSNPAKGQAKILFRLSAVRPLLARFEAKQTV